MYYKYPTTFYFSHLEGVDCESGTIINDDHARYPYLSFYKNAPDHGFSEMQVEHFNERAVINQPIGIFKAHEHEGHKFYCSEPHINKIFDVYTKIADNNVRLVTDNYRNEFKATFYKGYADSFKLPISSQFGEEFVNLTSDHKIIKLSEFCRYCKELSYFEGFAIPRVIYCIGYIQAAYFKAYAELVHLEALVSTQDTKALIHEDILEELPVDQNALVDTGEDILVENTLILPKEETPLIAPVTFSEDARIPIAFPLDELKIIWRPIMEIPRCKTLKVQVVETNQEKIDLLLSELFDHPLLGHNSTDSENKVCNSFDKSWKVPIGGLLYATKKRIERSGASTGDLIFYEAFATSKFSNCFKKEESNSKGSNLGRSYQKLKKKLQKYDDANFPNIKETLNFLTKYHL